MTAQIIDGKSFAERVRARVGKAVARLGTERGLTPTLAVLLVGENPASQVYVASKGKTARALGVGSLERILPATASRAEVVAVVDELNADPEVHGILIQLPLPKGLDEDEILARVDPAKDVDGFHPQNVAALALGRPGLVPCTPLGSLMLLKAQLGDLSGREAVVLGRSRIVGAPMAQLLLRENATVTIAHSRTRNLPETIRRAEILVAAVGRPEMVKGEWLRPGATVIDVGINRLPPDASGKARLVGDVDFASAAQAAGAITPVPGGVGPMTIACLMHNTVLAATRQAGLPDPEEFAGLVG
ncbi:bifunctional methylenetetrahydrofolate dehydrogenase/methenyltetrahydrofolate cyclohydrolase FolD [Neomegalonema sp.]|uniref:bifunctional methylenetetrahydrofolate dehydrogenase/methenyltetrahydrofolate cyclohydrolase FolD n=1 Tax=Neomegalonema sp. TaxID=2039713 RepID=UPI00260D9DD4|nr:bifunctional methylenetetrahydrofolate dehydrogenase/methenyltetrahydrofolate cyclohydrolase FolD [Neomegalonema sp.]MDD2869596.1 bifunctional methylenetetrahydrofolate dehydrogenase/methenyltetrahydrofolate cyclohydrolase FolD [Neomegalonema sp.]